jgi:hypothetical protein
VRSLLLLSTRLRTLSLKRSTLLGELASAVDGLIVLGEMDDVFSLGCEVRIIGSSALGRCQRAC